MVSASSFPTPSLIGFGAPSTKSLASFRPRLVTSRTALITLILLAPTSLRMTENSVFSSAGAAPAPAPAPPPAIITGAAAAAETPRRASSFFTRSAASRSDRLTIDYANRCRSAIVFSPSPDPRRRERLTQVICDFATTSPGFQCVQGQFPAPDNAKSLLPNFLFAIPNCFFGQHN